jgi:imidazolonepropionase
MNLVIRNIKQLVTVCSNGKRFKQGREMRDLGVIDDATVTIENGRFRWIGPSADFRQPADENVDSVDASDYVALPGFVDAHTHLVFGGSREDEFAMRAEGKTYQEIADSGGGILSTVRATRATTKKELKKRARRHLDGMLRHGTTTVEIKSGYGLNEDSEIKMLEAINELADESLQDIVPTFLGAHAIPTEYADNPDGYVELLCNRLLPYIAQRKIAKFCDAFCDRGYFSVEQCRRIFEAARALGLGVRVHADQLSCIGASKLAADIGALSADHLEHIDDAGIASLKSSGTIATVLPGVSLILNDGYPPARKIIDSGVPLAIASNFNPGTCMSYSMPLMMTIACTQMALTPEEAISAVTLNGAAALELSEKLGSIEIGKQADVLLFNVPQYRYIPYHFGINLVKKIIKRGTLLDFS